MEIDCFGSKVFVEKKIYFYDEKFQKSLDDHFSMTEGRTDIHQVGHAESSVSLGHPLQYADNYRTFLEIISPFIKQAGNLWGFEDSEGFDVARGWANKMYKGCKGRSHAHISSCDAVVIYYLNAPEDSANLYFTDVKIWGLLEENIPEKNKKRIITRTGTIVIHRPDLFHAISEHLSDEPRIVIILEIEFVKKTKEETWFSIN